ncbi:glycosyltransferase family 2 protein [Nostoc favosum]|uniref:Glycosyltransferase family 2 protein n=1 Tax=Nostoc favosum CHAB5714 TaxID=2780399 RepID=A0ABS8IAM1_9NOSO|nr:glycosyltransferase family 2 protein [Nostoc favosum]MCC5601250.1 glycosyltransferase family 2 protein [Nostoc favosum CHAB5714]
MLPKYSLIVPIYNEEEIIPELYRRLSAVMNRLDGLAELILINDGSRDRSLQLLRELHQKDPRICYLSFARNFGHQIAVTAGLNFVRGQVIIILDADLQDPPELIPDMIEKWRQGYQVVYAQRTQRLKEGWFKRFTAYSFYRVLKKLADVEIPTDTGDFCLMDRQIVDILNSMPERTRYIRGLRSWVGFQQTAIRFERNPRFAGEVKYTFSKSLALAINGLVSFSIVPLRLSTYLGLVAAAAAILMALLVLYWRLFVPHSPLTGFTIILMAIFFLGSVQLVSVGILGEYIGRIYEEVKARPLYTLAEVGGFYDNSNSTNNSDKLDNFQDATQNLDKY